MTETNLIEYKRELTSEFNIKKEIVELPYYGRGRYIRIALKPIVEQGCFA